MELIAFSVEGYRRFVTKTSVKLHGDLVAFVGPNEAGKSSLLRALAHLHNDDPFEYDEMPRRSSVKPKLAWHFLLSTDDKALLDDLPDCGHIERLIVRKYADGRKTWSFEPRDPRRSRATREQLIAQLGSLRDAAWVSAAVDSDQNELAIESIEGAIEILESDIDDYNQSRLDTFSELARRLETVSFHPTTETVETADGAGFVERSNLDQVVADEASRDEVVALVRQVVEEESGRSPFQRAAAALSSQLPQIELFAEADRRLAAEYDLQAVAEDPPPALSHLADLAHLDLVALRDEAVTSAVADVATRRNAANKRLLEAFDKSWNQEGIAIQIDVQRTILHIQATTPADEGLSSIGERSDGMLWFAALLAFSYGWSDKPVLLADELETHLHYDAQADLIRVLSQQRFTSKVIYTTHSFGCLPPDLGTGVRVVQPTSPAESRLENGFWQKGAGFSPLLASMGAAAMSLTPTRLALLAEGPSDAILLPSIFRRAAGVSRLPFQVAPGLAAVAPQAVGELDIEAGRVAFLVDGDQGGTDHAEKLTKAGVDGDRVLRLLAEDGEPLETEDLVDERCYVAAVNEELRCWNEVEATLTVDDVAARLRSKAVEAWCSDHGYDVPDKVAVAQRIVDSTEDQLVKSDRVQVVRELLDQVLQVLDVELDRAT